MIILDGKEYEDETALEAAFNPHLPAELKKHFEAAPPDEGNPKDSITPEKYMRDKAVQADPGNVTNDQGEIVDYDFSKGKDLINRMPLESPEKPAGKIQENWLTEILGIAQKPLEPIVKEIPSEENLPYPDRAAGREAQDYNFGYGSGNEAHIQTQVARVYDKATKMPARYAQLLDTPSSNVDLRDPKNAELREKLDGLSARAALAANRSAIASLGFDPDKINYQTKMPPLSVGGLYNPDSDKMWVNAFKENASPAVHETIHRGFEKLREKSPEAKKILDGMRIDEEYLVRYMMATKMGDPELRIDHNVSMEQRAIAMEHFKKFPKLSKDLDRLEEIAAELRKEQRPRGPK